MPLSNQVHRLHDYTDAEIELSQRRLAAILGVDYEADHQGPNHPPVKEPPTYDRPFNPEEEDEEEDGDEDDDDLEDEGNPDEYEEDGD